MDYISFEPSMSIRAFGFSIAVILLVVVVGSDAVVSNTNLLASSCNTKKINYSSRKPKKRLIRLGGTLLQ
jgi:hypothetical protein